MKTMAEVIRDHQPTTGMSVASGVTCQCGYWNGEERAGVDRPPGFQGLIWHQGQELAAAGYGPVKEAQDRVGRRYAALHQLLRDELRAQAWDEGRESLALDFTRPLGAQGMRSATPNPYRAEDEP